MKQKQLCLAVIALLICSHVSAQFKIDLSKPLQPKVTLPDVPKPKLPKIVIGKKPLENFNKVVQDAVDGAGKLIPEKVQKLATQLVGESAKLSGDVINIYRVNNQVISQLTLNGLDLYKDISEPVTEQLIKLKDGTLNAVGVTLPTDIDKVLNEYISQNQTGFEQLYKLYSKSLEIEDKLLDGSAQSLKEFGKYLLLSTNGFPGMKKGMPLPKLQGLTTLSMNPRLLQIMLDQLLKDAYRTGNDHSKPFQVIAVSSGSLRYDDQHSAFVLELNDAKIRHNQPTGFARLSATLNIKKLRLQVIPVSMANGALTVKTRLCYLDVEDLLPKLDEMLCWVFEDNVMSKISKTFMVSELLNTEAKIEKSNIDHLILRSQPFDASVFATSQQMGIVYKDKVNTVQDTELSGHDMEVKFNEGFVLKLINNALDSTKGVKVAIDKKATEFDESKNHIFLKHINKVDFKANGALYIGAECSVHFRRFLGKKPKINILFSNVGLNLYPVLETSANDAKLKMSLVPVVDSLALTGSSVKSRIIRRIAKLFKASKASIVLQDMPLKSLMTFNFSNPLKPEEKLLPIARDLKLLKSENDWRVILDFK
ncbi:hypothetical protein VRU48_02765 [Pedobacter sp. KR3-3]|uniref:DUF4403 family protein n=1 Tax=Pedobacter albus TaxID=3113905 RepID=A0ABU7I3I7_9SPHI|nr:hypothetical protein [Pedobacter sp. KR3-3]MEE1944013.1 hypothetical protein [Pedobacter sp. KR3-3]